MKRKLLNCASASPAAIARSIGGICDLRETFLKILLNFMFRQNYMGCCVGGLMYLSPVNDLNHLCFVCKD